MANDKFERVEKKFWMSSSQYAAMNEILLEHGMHVDEFGHSRIRNIYCDNDDYYLIRNSIDAIDFKEKLRIRSYNGFETDSKVFVEIKRKVGGVGFKRRVIIDPDQLTRLFNGENFESSNKQIGRELQEFIKRYKPELKVYLTYERDAMYCENDPALRITIDSKIRYRLYEPDMDFTKEGIPVMQDETMRLMEVKAPGCLPSWLIDGLSRNGIYQTPFSKIGTTFTRYIAPELQFEGHAGKREIPIQASRYAHVHMAAVM